jgi:ATP-dependent Clp protease ATP-binding subunit ClpC
VFERFTDRARRVLVLAQEEAARRNHGFLGTEHILLGLVRERDGLAATALESLGVTGEAVQQKVDERVPRGDRSPAAGAPPFTPRAKKVFELSLREALRLHHNYIGTEHLLLGIVREGEGVAAQALAALGATPERVREQLLGLLSRIESPEGRTTKPSGAADALDKRVLRMGRDMAALVAEVSEELERLRAEVERLRALLVQHGIDAEGGAAEVPERSSCFDRGNAL